MQELEINNNIYQLILKAQNGNKKAMEIIVENNQNLIWSIVRRFNDRGYELEDLFQIGAIGLVKAIKNFSMEYKTKLSTYAVPMILGEIKRFLRDDGIIKVSRKIKELYYEIKNIQKENEKFGNETSIETLKKQLNVTEEEILMALDLNLNIESLDKKYSEDDDSTLLNKIKNSKDEYKNLLDNLEIRELYNILNDKEKIVIFNRYYKEKKQKEIAEILGITQVQISRIEKSAIEKMRNECNKK